MRGPYYSLDVLFTACILPPFERPALAPSDGGRGREDTVEFAEWTISYEAPRWIIQTEHGPGKRAVAWLVGDYIECRDAARLITAAPDLYAAAGNAITAICFAMEDAARAEDEVGLGQLANAKNKLIAAMNKATSTEDERLALDRILAEALGKAGVS